MPLHLPCCIYTHELRPAGWALHRPNHDHSVAQDLRSPAPFMSHCICIPVDNNLKYCICTGSHRKMLASLRGMWHAPGTHSNVEMNTLHDAKCGVQASAQSCSTTG